MHDHRVFYVRSLVFKLLQCRSSTNMSLSAEPPRKRLKSKTTVAMRAPVVGVALDAEEPSGRKSVYLVTFAHTAGPGLRSPGTLSREGVRDAVLDAFANPVYEDAGNRAAHNGGQQASVQRLVVFAEYHKPDDAGAVHLHYHVAVQCACSVRFLPLKRSLRARHNLASHWSCSHVGYWSAVRYCAMPSPAKPADALDPCPLAWKSDGEHEPLDECMEQPSNASAIAGRRLQARRQAAQAGREEPRPSEVDVWPLVVRHGIRNTADNQQAHLRLIQIARETCSPAMLAFLFRIRKRLPALIDDVWTWEEIHDHVALSEKSRMDCLLASARQTCCCGGQWHDFVGRALLANGTDVHVSQLSNLCRDILPRILKTTCQAMA